MKIEIVIAAVFVPLIVISVFSLIVRLSGKVKTDGDKNSLIVKYPKGNIFIGAFADSLFILMGILFTIFSEETPHVFMYIILGFFVWAGFYIIFKTLTFKLIIEDYEITVYSAFRKPYQITYDNISSVKRQVKGNAAGSERMLYQKTDITNLRCVCFYISYEDSFCFRLNFIFHKVKPIHNEHGLFRFIV